MTDIIVHPYWQQYATVENFTGKQQLKGKGNNDFRGFSFINFLS